MQLQGKVVLITGASTGIGRATAKHFARAGAKVALMSRNQTALQQLANEIQAGNGQALVVAADITKIDEIHRSIEQTLSQWQQLDILINNAGHGVLGQLQATPMTDIRQLFEVNVFAPIQLIQAVYPQMQKQKAGQIINVSSIVSLRAIPSVAAYCMTKHALNALSDAFRIEAQAHGVEVLSVYPGSTSSDFHKNQKIIGNTPPHPKWFVKTPDDVAAAILKASVKHQRDTYLTLSSRLMAWVDFVSPHLLDRILAYGYRKYSPD